MTPADFSVPLLAQGNALFPGSKSFSLLVPSISIALSTWIINPLSVQILGATSGLAGAGTVNGFITTAVGVGVVLPAFQAAGFTGQTAPTMALIIENGIRQAVSGKAYQGASAGVGSGSDVVVKVVANGPALTALLQASLAGASLVGLLTPTLCLALGQGIAALVATCVGAGTVTGGGNFAGVGTSLSRFV